MGVKLNKKTSGNMWFLFRVEYKFFNSSMYHKHLVYFGANSLYLLAIDVGQVGIHTCKLQLELLCHIKVVLDVLFH
jgi:hypothetical protein